ncbi:Dephospho-CoA kinase [Aspergillus sp. HF37]|nr:Dephospho-CoA kinase [Aspergillus sp. HF37]
MLIIGLTGSIATGKSTVSSILRSPPYNLPVIDADVVARKVVEPGTRGYEAIVRYFGPSTPDLLLDADGWTDGGKRALNRPALGRRVFGSSAERQRDRQILNSIVHPAVRREIYKELMHSYMRGHWAVVLDVPLLFESGMDVLCGTVVVVAVRDEKVQMERLRARDAHLSAEDAENRVRSQGDVQGKVDKAQFRGAESARGVVVWNDGGKEDLENEVRRAMAAVAGSSPLWWTWLLLLVPPVGVGVAVWNLVLNFWRQKSWESRMRKEKARL